MTSLAAILVAAQAVAADAPTFSKDVARIFQEKCQQCHQPNSIAPMSLITYEEARPWARAIKQRVGARQMPPWHIDPSVGVQKFKNDMSLTDNVLHVTANDYSGEGGGGEVCCWTTAMVNVSVTP